ncbi:MAG: hypothetical protein IJR57_06730, partial [Ruminococcus sp.]|nr:hypothetical protein [Ruminococcus sp.]
MRKLISILLAVLLVASMTLGAAALPVPKMLLAAVGEGESEDTYAVAGSVEELFTKTWGDGIPENPMTKNDDGTYSRTYTADKAYDEVQLK